MSQLFDKNRRTKKNLKTPKEIIWEVEEKNHLNINPFQKIIYKFTWFFLFLIRFCFIHYLILKLVFYTQTKSVDF